MTNLAFEELYNEHIAQVSFLIRSRIEKSCDVEDLIHDIFLKIWEYRKNIDQDRSVGGLLYRMALNAVCNYNRHEQVVKKFERYSDRIEFDTSELPDSILAVRELNSRIKLVLRDCPRKEKEVFKLFWEEGLSRQQIAKEEGLSVRTVDNHIYRAKKKVKQVLK